jgi:hypothetical protein
MIKLRDLLKEYRNEFIVLPGRDSNNKPAKGATLRDDIKDVLEGGGIHRPTLNIKRNGSIEVIVDPAHAEEAEDLLNVYYRGRVKQ